MTIELGVIIPIGFTFLSGIVIYLFTMLMAHEKRIQSIEDIQGSKIDDLKKDFEEMEKKIDKLTQSVSELSLNIHKSKNQENALNSTLSAILKHLNKDEK